MSTHWSPRRKWDVDQILDGLLGENVRVAAKSLAPPSSQGANPFRFVPVRELYLPDSSQPAGLPVFVEGRLHEFERQIGVVWVRLGAPAVGLGTPEGVVLFRRQTVVMLRGPAVVELAFPFRVERLPTDPANYWRDVRLPGVQFELAWAVDGPRHEEEGNGPNKAMLSQVCARGLD